jgi:hypothetical protein
MPVSYTHRKGLTYTLYRGQTKIGKPCYSFGRAGQCQDEPVTELPIGFTISESINGVVSLLKHLCWRCGISVPNWMILPFVAAVSRTRRHSTLQYLSPVMYEQLIR